VKRHLYSMETAKLLNKKCILKCILLMVMLVMFVMICNPEVYDQDYDMWWHLKYGEYFVQHHTWIIDHSMFSWSPTVSDWKYVSWLGDVLMYLIFTLFSFTGLYSIQIISLLAIYSLYMYYLKTIGDDVNILHILSLFLVSYTIYQTSVKTELFSVFFFALVVFIYIYSKTSSRHLFYIYPPLFLLWVNIHGVFIFGVLLITSIFFLELLDYAILRKSPLPGNLLKSFGFSVILSYAVLLVNPYGINYHLGLLKDLFFSDYMNYTVGYIAAFKSLWTELFPSGFSIRPIQIAWFMVVMMAMFILVNAYVYAKTKKTDPTIIVINLLFFALSMMTGRARYYFPLIWLFSMPYLYRDIRTLIAPQRTIKWMAVMLLAYFVATNIYFTGYFSNLSWLGINIRDSVPEKEVAFIKEHKLPGPFFNDYLTGGYMIWSLYPDYKVFIDPRYGPYVKGVVGDWFELKSRTTPEELDKLTAKYGFKAALINLSEQKIISLFLHSPEWKLVYFDKRAAVIVTKSFYEENNARFSAIDLSPARFHNIDDPEILLHLFTMYAFTAGPHELNEIASFYRDNVRDSYAFKKSDLQNMQFNIKIFEGGWNIKNQISNKKEMAK
jgi:hypothetical protein